MKRRFCFVTEADLDRRGVGGVITDLQMLEVLKEFGEVDVIHLQRIRYRSTSLALLFFFARLLKSFSKPYNAYFSRGLTASFLLVSLNISTLKRRKIVKRSLSVPFASKEVKFLKYGVLESSFRYFIFRFLEHFVYSHIDSVTVASKIYEEELIEAGMRSDKIHITNFTAGGEFFDQPLKSNRDKTFKFCYVGGFHLYQDLLPVLEAFEIAIKTKRDIELVFVGDGPQRRRLEEETADKALRNVKFRGRISHALLPRFLAEIDCFISLTRKPGLSISIVEAAATGKPVIAYAPRNTYVYNDYFRHKKEIYLVNSLSPNEIAEAMDILYQDAILRSNIAEGARRVAQQYFGREAACDQIEALILRIDQTQ